jgi:hypothetical protein
MFYGKEFGTLVLVGGHEAQHSLLSSAKVKNAWNYTSMPPYAFMEWYLIKHRVHLHGALLG